jgi:DNA sulfur modification protein DndB
MNFDICQSYATDMSSKSFTYTFPSVRGIQAGREFFVSQVPIRMLPRLFVFEDADLPTDMRTQRTLNQKRIPGMANYVISNRNDYTFSAITASIDAEITFEPVGPEDDQVGRLRLPMDARFIINDGQHRWAALKAAALADPSLNDETISVVFFVDIGLARSQQMFADLNRHGVRPSASIGILFDHREELANTTRQIVKDIPVLRDLVEPEKSTLVPLSRKLFTLSAVHGTHKALFIQIPPEQQVEVAHQFWNAVVSAMPEWSMVHNNEAAARDIRQDFIHTHGTVLHALGRSANHMIRYSDKWSWEKFTKALKSIDWRRNNSALWEGRALSAGRVSKANQSVTLTSNVIKKSLGLTLSADEERLEISLSGGKNV